MSKYNSLTSEVIKELESIVGEEYVLTEKEKIEQYKTDEETDEIAEELVTLEDSEE